MLSLSLPEAEGYCPLPSCSISTSVKAVLHTLKKKYKLTPPSRRYAPAPCEPVARETAVPDNADPGAATDLLFRLLSLDPARRPTAAQALRDDYFTSEPAAMAPGAAAAELMRGRRLRSPPPPPPPREGGVGGSEGGGEKASLRGEAVASRLGLSLAPGELRAALDRLGLDGELDALA